jgi:lytic murein transglycosylase
MRLAPAAALSLALALPAAAQPCGGSFQAFVQGLEAEAVAGGIPVQTVAAFFRGVEQDQRVLSRDRQQGFFTRPFTEFARNLISQGRLDRARQLMRQEAALFERARRSYGVPPGILLAFLAFETDFGAFQGDFNTRNALVTLAHDCRRPQLFRPQVLAMIELYRRGVLDPATTVGAWAGEIGMLQMLPTDILTLGVDGDGDGRVDPRSSLPDAVLSGAALLAHHGWRPNEPWLHEVRVPPNFQEWSLTGLRTEMPVSAWVAMGIAPAHGALPDGNLPASLILPQGAGGPAFLIFPNFRVLFEWNQSFTYVLTAAYFATRIEGAPVFQPGNPREGLTREQMQELQRLLTARGYDTGGTTGILGARTRIAVQDFQASLGLPADGWPTPELLRHARR